MLRLARKQTLRVAGLMSGTSADGVDVAVVDIGPRGLHVVAFNTYPYAAALRRRIFELFDPRSGAVDKICHMNAVLGEVFAQAVVQLCLDKRIKLSSIDLIGSHGQTIWHQPQSKGATPRGAIHQGTMPCRVVCGKACLGLDASRVPSTLQIGEPSIIAQRTGITTVADFRPRDMAAGGQGAPLVPFADMVLLGHPTLTRAVQNIGGIANVTFLPPLGTGSGAVCRRLPPLSLPDPRPQRAKRIPDPFFAFDTGPGNMIIDRITQHVTSGRQSFDKGGRLAAAGSVNSRLLGELLRHPYLRRRPPKTTGREMFGVQFADGLWTRARKRGLRPLDVLATATAFTAASIADAYRRLLPRLPDETILCGGGARNATLATILGRELAPARVVTMDSLGINADAKEAISFAILAYATIKGIPSNVPAATGASQAVVLGKIVPGRNRFTDFTD